MPLDSKSTRKTMANSLCGNNQPQSKYIPIYAFSAPPLTSRFLIAVNLREHYPRRARVLVEYTGT